MNNSFHVAIVGARCERQGTGPWFAKHLQNYGAQVSAVMGRSKTTAQLAADELKEKFSIDCRAYYQWDKLLEEARPDLLVIASPAETHREYLKKAIEAQLPVLVEKPFIWDSARDNVDDVEKLLQGIEESHLPVYVNTQWIETLDLFKTIYPECDMGQVHHFEMGLSPSSTGKEMMVDALPHAWNMLCTLCGEGEVAQMKVEFEGENCSKVSGEFHGQGVVTKFLFNLTTCVLQPRPFYYQINGHRVDRKINLSDYSMSFEAKNADFPLEDPMVSRIRKILTLLEKKSYNVALRRTILETKLLNQSIEVLQA